MIDTVKLCELVLKHLIEMGYESTNVPSSGQLIFPLKIQADGKKVIDRISEQELRQLFIEEFKNNYQNLYYSVETRTNSKYSFGKSYEDIIDGSGKSASVDMCIFERISNRYKRVLNVEFKSGNPPIRHIAKDIKKLICENKDGVFIHLLQNSNSGTFRNQKNTGIFDKYCRSLEDFKINWENYKAIHFILISLKQKAIIHRLIEFKDLDNLQTIFYKNTTCGPINKINGNGWEILNL